MGRPARDEQRDTRKEILEAALDLFSQSGFAGTSMRQIARAVGVRESALYHHFPSKEAIFVDLVELYGPGKLGDLKAVDVEAVAQVGLPTMLRTFAHAILTEWSTPREQKWIRLVMSEAPRMATHGGVPLSVFVERAVAVFAGLFLRLMDRGLMRKGDPASAAHEWMSGIMMLRLRFMAVNPGPVDLKKVKALADGHVEHFCRATAPEADPKTKRTFTRQPGRRRA